MVNFGKLMPWLLVLPLVFFLNFGAALGQEEECIVPTIPKNVEGIENLLRLQWDPANPDEIQPDTSAEVKVTGGSLPLGWSVSGNGFSLKHVKTADRSNILEADSTACGTAKIEVTDGWGTTVNGDLRCENGQWYLVQEERCSYWQRDWCAYCTCIDTFEIGAYRYQNSWIGDKACQMSEETCGPYGGGADLRGNKCYVVGYYTPAYCNTFFSRSMWEWRCPP